MTISGDLFFAVWGVLLAAHLGLLIPFSRRWTTHKDRTAARIRKHNARRGYGQSVSKEDLAEAFTNPLKTDDLTEFAEQNEMTAAGYREELKEEIGSSTLPLLTVSYQVGATLFAVSGIAFLATSALMSREIYLLILGGTMFLSILFYLIT